MKTGTRDPFLKIRLSSEDARLSSARWTREAMEAYFSPLGKKIPSVRILPGGKPVFSHSEFHFSVSHSGPLHVTVIAHFPVGVDAEKTEENSERVAERYFDDEEKKLPFARVWTGKEAVVKLTGEGLSALRRVRVREGKAELDGKTYLLSYRETEGYTVAIATEGREKNGRKAISEK